MASRRRRGRPRKNGTRFKSGKLKRPPKDPLDSARMTAVAQPHRKGLGDQVLSQLAESELGRMLLAGLITKLQHLAGAMYGRQYAAYLATMDGPRFLGKRGAHSPKPCGGCLTKGEREKCTCDLAKRSWNKSWTALERVQAGWITTDVVSYDCPAEGHPSGGGILSLKRGLDVLIHCLGLTSERKSGLFRNTQSQHAPPD